MISVIIVIVGAVIAAGVGVFYADDIGLIEASGSGGNDGGGNGTGSVVCDPYSLFDDLVCAVTDWLPGSGGGGPVTDILAPNIEITSPASFTEYESGTRALTITGKATDNVGVALVEGSVNNGEYMTASGTGLWQIGIVNLSDGQTYSVTIRAKDAAGNIQTASTAFAIKAVIVIDDCPTGYHLENGNCVVDTPGSLVWANLRGVNFIDPVLRKMEHQKPMPVDTTFVETFVPKLKDMNMNLIRVPIYWESYPGNEANFLSELELIVETARQNGIYVTVDFHHFDATSYWKRSCGTACGSYSSYGLGFPKSLVGLYHPTTSYEQDSEVVAFWNDYYLNKVRGPNGSTIDAWNMQAEFMKKVIAKVNSYPNVIGYEIINEPHMFKVEHYKQLGDLQTSIGKKIRDVTDKPIVFTRETGHHGFKRQPTQETLIVPRVTGDILFMPHRYDYSDIDTDITRWLAWQQTWQNQGYKVKAVGVGEWATQPPQTSLTVLTDPVKAQDAMDKFVAKWKSKGLFWTYWSYGCFNCGDGNVLINEDGSLTKYGQYVKNSIGKYYPEVPGDPLTSGNPFLDFWHVLFA